MQCCDNCLHSRIGPERIQVCVHEVATFYCSISTWNAFNGCPVGRVMVHCTGKWLWQKKEVAAE